MPTPADLARMPHRPLTVRPVDPTAHGLNPPTSRTGQPTDDFAFRYTAAVLGSALHPRAKRVALLLLDRADPRTGRIQAEGQLGVRALSSLTGLSTTAVKTSVEKLRRGGWLRRTRTAEGQPARIELLLPSTPARE
jgi:hypothetical protein